VLALGVNDGAFAKLWSISLDGSGAKVAIEEPGRDVVGVYSDPLTRAALAVYLGGLASDVRWLDAAGEGHAAGARFPRRASAWLVARW
jgi:hypothetical protein